MKTLFRTALIVSLCATAHAGVVRPAPNFGIEGVRPGTSLKSFRGQAVVLVITKNARVKDFRRQVYRLKEMYGQFATEKVLFVAAIQDGSGDVPSDIPFAVAANGAQIAADYGVTGNFAIAVIGVDGNLDMITTKVIPAARVKDVVFNNYESQQASRKQPST